MIKCIIEKIHERGLVSIGSDGGPGKPELSHFGISRLLPSYFLVLAAILVFGVCVPSYASSGDPCDCPKLDCNSCENQTGLTFYSEKCGNNRVRSCSRPSCQLKDPIPPGCEVSQKKGASEVPDGDRTPASAAAANESLPRGGEIGKVMWSKGESWLVEPSGKQHSVRVGISVHTKDKVKTEAQAEIRIEFQDANELHIQPQSEVLMSEYESDSKLDRRALLDLIKGKVRSKVKQKYKGDTSSYFKVRTKSAVAGVRGTDFVVSFNIGHKEITKVETLTGSVVLANADQSQSLDVSKGTYASYVVEANSSEVFSDKEINEFVARGYMTPVHKMSAKEIEQLDWESSVGEKPKGKTVSMQEKGASKSVCQSPQAEMDQCYWVCENNPKGEKNCRTDLPQVNCLRRRCDANGKWADETRLPANFHEQCQAKGVRVGPCDY